MKKRQESREQAFILVFEKQFNPESSVEELCSIALDAGLFESDSFVSALAKKTFDSVSEIDETICRYLANGWKIARLSKVVLAILRLAVCEILYFDSVPYAVSINEAVELAKKYASEQDPAFVNAILGSVVKNLDDEFEDGSCTVISEDNGIETTQKAEIAENADNFETSESDGIKEPAGAVE